MALSGGDKSQDETRHLVIAGLICNLAAVVVLLFSWLVFRETLSKKAAVGLADIVAGTLLLLF